MSDMRVRCATFSLKSARIQSNSDPGRALEPGLSASQSAQRRVVLSREKTQSGSYFWGDHHADDELTRLKLIEQFNDPSAFRHLDAIGARARHL
jgi:hypothetical protein